MNKLDDIQAIVEGLIEGTDCFLVSAKCSPGHNYKFFIDADSSFDIKRCITINRKLRNIIDEKEWFPNGEYSLEVSSPGIDEPLLSTRQFQKNVNRLVEITFNDSEQKPIIGRIQSVDEQKINLKIEDKKKKTSVDSIVERQNIKKAVIQIEF
jgi:ribosome maturation factor RimP